MRNIKYMCISALDKLLRRYLRYRSKNSNYIKYANKEFNITWGDFSDDDMQCWMADDVLDILSLLSMQGDSGSTIGYKLGLLNKLIKFNPIAPLTFEDDEFSPADINMGTSRQNKRNSSVFLKDNGVITYLDGFIKQSAYHFFEGVWEDGTNTTWHGSTYVMPEDGSPIYRINGSAVIKDKKKFSGKSYYIPTYEIECPKGWWLSFVKESDLKEFLEEYDVQRIENTIEEEFNFKGGIYRQSIYGAIDSMIKKMGLGFTINDVYDGSKNNINAGNSCKR